MNLILIVLKLKLKLYDRVNFVNFIVLFLFVNFFNHLWKLILSKNSVIFFKKYTPLLKPHNITEKKMAIYYFIYIYIVFFGLLFYNFFFFFFFFLNNIYKRLSGWIVKLSTGEKPINWLANKTIFKTCFLLNILIRAENSPAIS